MGELTVHDVEIGSADPAGTNPDQDLARAGLWRSLLFLQSEGCAGFVENHRPHSATLRIH